MANESVTLYFFRGSSDKVYKVALFERDGKWHVQFEYGRRGNSMTTGDKCEAGADYDTAKKVYDVLVKSKTKKGYKPGPDSEEYVPPKGAAAASIASRDIPLPMLLKPIDESDTAIYVGVPTWVAQEKYDGKRIVLDCKPGEVVAINRSGKACGIPKCVETDALALAAGLGHITIDGELMGETFVAFDLLRIEGKSITSLGFVQRWQKLEENVADECEAIRVASVYRESKEKAAFVAKLRKDRAEGVVFKESNAAYEPAVRSEFARKLKFYATASCIVTKVNTKHSVALGLMNEHDDIVDVGNVTVPANQSIPFEDDIVEVRYLYAYRGGSLYQPVLLGVRDDISIDDCDVNQLKYKKDED